MKLHTAMYVKQWLKEVGEGCPYDFYKWYRQKHPTISYIYIAQTFYYLRKLGLIEKVREEESSRSPIKRAIYRIVEGKEDDERWSNPQKYV